MSRTVDDERTEASIDAKIATGRRRLQECMDVHRLTAEGLTVALIHQRLGLSRDKVRALQFWLGWRTSKMKWVLNVVPRGDGSRPGSRWCMRYPEDGQVDDAVL
jgi:hypothetical protein